MSMGRIGGLSLVPGLMGFLDIGYGMVEDGLEVRARRLILIRHLV